jgi:hypothetical protein
MPERYNVLQTQVRDECVRVCVCAFSSLKVASWQQPKKTHQQNGSQGDFVTTSFLHLHTPLD